MSASGPIFWRNATGFTTPCRGHLNSAPVRSKVILQICAASSRNVQYLDQPNPRLQICSNHTNLTGSYYFYCVRCVDVERSSHGIYALKREIKPDSCIWGGGGVPAQVGHRVTRAFCRHFSCNVSPDY